MISTPLDAVITDPPYSAFRQGGSSSTNRYFTATGGIASLPPIEGETMDQHAYMNWTRWWMGACRRLMRPGAILLSFTNHSMLVPTIDGMQQSGLTYRGVFVWHKPVHRPQKNRYTNAAEFAVWGTNGQRSLEGPPVVGFFSQSPPPVRKRLHQTEKPQPLMEHLLQITKPGDVVLDPFMGSGTTLIAALAMGRRAIGIEASEEIYDTARRRLAELSPTITLGE